MAFGSFHPSELGRKATDLMAGSDKRFESSANGNLRELRLKLADAVRSGDKKNIEKYAQSIQKFEAALRRTSSPRR